MLKELKDWIKLIIVVLILIGFYQLVNYIQDSNGKGNGVEVIQDQPLKPISKDDEKYVPKGSVAHGKTDIINKSEDPSKKKKTSVIVHSDGKCVSCTPKVTVVTKIEDYYGFTNEPKFYIGVVGESPAIGYAHSIARFNKLTTDLMIGVPSLGLGLGYQLTNNSFLGVGANIKYINFKSMTDFSSYNIGIQIPLQTLPIGYFGFKF